MKTALRQLELPLSPMFWNAKTINTEAAIIKNEPI